MKFSQMFHEAETVRRKKQDENRQAMERIKAHAEANRSEGEAKPPDGTISLMDILQASRK